VIGGTAFGTFVACCSFFLRRKSVGSLGLGAAGVASATSLVPEPSFFFWSACRRFFSSVGRRGRGCEGIAVGDTGSGGAMAVRSSNVWLRTRWDKVTPRCRGCRWPIYNTNDTCSAQSKASMLT